MDPIRTDQSSHLVSSATSGTGNTLEDLGEAGVFGVAASWSVY
jgi:hypothetical protein